MTLHGRVLRSLAWQGWASLLGQTISWLGTLLVIRLLQPTDYGLMASASVLLGLLAALSELGVGAAVVQARELPRERIRDLQALIWLLGAAGGLAMAASGGALAWIYSEPRLADLAPVLALSLPLTALYVLPQALALRELRFDQKAFADLGAALISTVAALGLALTGAGVLALAAGVITTHATRALVYAALQRGWPLPSLSLRGTRSFLRFGLLASTDRLLWFMLGSVDVVILGKLLGETTLGLYVVALTLASLPLEKIAPVLTQVSFPAFAHMQADPLRVRHSVLRSVRYGALVFVPIAWGAALVAPEALPLVLGERWDEIVVPFQMISAALPLRALGVLITPALFGTGQVRTNIANLALSLLLMAPAFYVGAAYGLRGAALAWLLVYPIVFLLTTLRAARALGLSLGSALRTCRPAAAGGLALVACVSLVRAGLGESPILSLALAIPIGAAAYLAAVRLVEPGMLGEIRGLLAPAHAE